MKPTSFMTNKEIISKLNRTVKLMELHGVNEFKIRTYSNAIFKLEHGGPRLSELSLEEVSGIEGIGKTIASTIQEIKETGSSKQLEQLLAETPEGVLDLLALRGLGIKKLITLWKEFDITSKQDLESALHNELLNKAKGFGGKTLEKLMELLEFDKLCQGKIYYANAEKLGNDIIAHLKTQISGLICSFSGRLRRKWSVIDDISLICSEPEYGEIEAAMKGFVGVVSTPEVSGPFTWRGRSKGVNAIKVSIHLSSKQSFFSQLLIQTGTRTHLEIGNNQSLKSEAITTTLKDEQQAYLSLGIGYCEPENREGTWERELAAQNSLPELINTKDLRGIIHTHTTYSDGQNTIQEMAEACREMGFEYLGISDHSKAAYYYANGLFEERVVEQQKEIDTLNDSLKSFRLFKGIEADILATGALDYDKQLLSTFDFVVASVHSGLSMDMVKATDRLLRAIENPYTTILGHMTGRLLLLREGYPVDHNTIIKACAEHEVIIEINAHPKRLDIDWRWVHKAIEEGVVLSINPDAHEIRGFDDMYYGVCVGRKGGLTKKHTFNAWPVEQVAQYFEKRKLKSK